MQPPVSAGVLSRRQLSSVPAGREATLLLREDDAECEVLRAAGIVFVREEV